RPKQTSIRGYWRPTRRLSRLAPPAAPCGQSRADGLKVAQPGADVNQERGPYQHASTRPKAILTQRAVRACEKEEAQAPQEAQAPPPSSKAARDRPRHGNGHGSRHGLDRRWRQLAAPAPVRPRLPLAGQR